VTVPLETLRLRDPSPALRRAQRELAPQSEASVRRRIAWIWALLLLNVLPYTTKSALVPLPTTVGKLITQGALGVAFILALSINRKVLFRPNLFLLLMTILCITSVMMSIRGYYGLGSVLRAGRLAGFVAILWLLTPWWGHKDLLMLRVHRRALTAILVIVVLGLVLFPTKSLNQAGGGRLGGSIWPIQPTTVAHYAAILAGTTVVLWFAGLIKPRSAAIVTALSVGIVLGSHTRTALIALLAAVLVAGLSLFMSRERVRKALVVTLIVSALAALSFAPIFTSWFDRGQSKGQLTALTGRTTVWAELKAQPRTEVNTLFGYGMSNDSFDGSPIDSSWYSTYLTQGLVGDVIDGAVLLILLLIAVFSPRGPRRALALFLVVYCLIASFTQDGLGSASPYLLDLSVAMSVLMVPVTTAPVALAAPTEL
jgi:O-Antigen ligase